MSLPTIHPTAIVAPGAQLAAGVTVGPFCTIGADVVIGEGTRLVSHVVVSGHTTIGSGNTIYPFACLGLDTPDLKYRGEPTTLVIGHGNTVREYVTMHIGTAVDKGTTVVGDHNLFMPGTHIAHDCLVGSHCILANFVQLAGHVTLDNHVIIGGLTGVRQHVRIGAHAMIGGATGVEHDVPPYGNFTGEGGHLKGLNLVGLRRRGFARESIQALNDAFELLFAPATDEHTLQQRAESLKTNAVIPEITQLADFVLTAQRGLATYEDD